MPPPCVLCSPMLFTNVVLCSLPLCSDQCGTFLCTLLGLWLSFWAPASPWVGLNQTEAKVARTSADSRSLCPGGREDLIDAAKSLQNLLSQTFPEAPGHSSKGTHSNSTFFSYQLGTLGESFDLKSLAFLMCRMGSGCGISHGQKVHFLPTDPKCEGLIKRLFQTYTWGLSGNTHLFHQKQRRKSKTRS